MYSGEDEVVVLDDVRPLEPYVVHLSDSSSKSSEEDEEEEHFFLPLSNHELSVVREDEGHGLGGLEVEETEDGLNNQPGEEATEEGVSVDLNSPRRNDETDLPPLHEKGTDGENMSNMLVADKRLLEVVSEIHVDGKDGSGEVEPDAESDERELDKEVPPAGEVREEINNEEDTENGQEDLENGQEDLQTCEKDYRKDGELLEPDIGNGEKFGREGGQDQCVGRNVEVSGLEEELDTASRTREEQHAMPHKKNAMGEQNLAEQQRSMKSRKSLEEDLLVDENHVEQQNLEEQQLMQSMPGDSAGEQNLILQRISSKLRSLPNVFQKDDLLVLEQSLRSHSSGQNRGEFEQAVSKGAETLDKMSSKEGRALKAEAIGLKNKVEELAKELLRESNMIMQQRKEQVEEHTQDQGEKEEKIEDRQEVNYSEEATVSLCFSNEGLKVSEKEEEHIKQKSDTMGDCGKGEANIGICKLEDLIEGNRAQGEVKKGVKEFITWQAEDGDGNFEEEIIDCLSEDEDMSGLDSDDSDDDSDVDIVEVTEKFPNHHFLKKDCTDDLAKTEISSIGEKILTKEGKQERMAKEDSKKTEIKEVQKQESEVDSDIDTAAWHQRPQEVPSSKMLEVEERHCPLPVTPGLRLVPWLGEADNQKTSKEVKKAKLKTSSKSVKQPKKGLIQKISNATKKEENGVTTPLVLPERSVVKPAVKLKKLSVQKVVKKTKSSRKLSTITKSDDSKVAKHVSKSKKRTSSEVSLESSGYALQSGKDIEVKKLPATFKIPKGNYQSQRLHTTGDERVDSFLAEEQISLNADLTTFLRDEEDFGRMFESVNKLSQGSKIRAKELSKSESQLEMEDLSSDGWGEVRKLSCDKERVKKAQEEFGNPVPSDPFRNLTVHGFRSKATRKRKLDWVVGGAEPQSSTSGVSLEIRKRKLCEAILPFCSQPEEKASSKRIRHQDFQSVMKTVFFHKFKKSQSYLKTSNKEQVTSRQQ